MINIRVPREYIISCNKCNKILLPSDAYLYNGQVFCKECISNINSTFKITKQTTGEIAIE